MMTPATQCVPRSASREKKALGRAEDAASRDARRANVPRGTLDVCPMMSHSGSARRFASREIAARSRTHPRTSPRGSNGETRVLEAIGFLLAVESGGRGGEVRRGVQVGDATRARGLRARGDASQGLERTAKHVRVLGRTRTEQQWTGWCCTRTRNGRNEANLRARRRWVRINVILDFLCVFSKHA